MKRRPDLSKKLRTSSYRDGVLRNLLAGSSARGVPFGWQRRQKRHVRTSSMIQHRNFNSHILLSAMGTIILPKVANRVDELGSLSGKR